ncbi:lipopolysaccharide assembly protein LapB [Taibaiella sp. KBW10]|uniref:tetratricopeptide repeat protein n=1 Tax=Taibaiella sp. KBW10 TaxID=2153357 RepID=UPI000F5AB4E5|nr:hypothetical protein [Taibaiella sp. KBW10]
MFKKAALLAIFFCLFFTLRSLAGYYYDFNTRCQSAYQAYTSFKIAEANKLLEAELKDHPNNLIAIYLYSYDDVFTLLFRGDPAELKRRRNNLSIRMNVLDKGDKNSPWYAYTKATLYFHWAAINIRFNDMTTGANLFRKSYNNLKENQSKFPNFKQNDILLGVAEGMIGTIPNNYKWMVNLLGFKGSVKSGNTRIINYLNNTGSDAQLLKEEAIVYYCYFKSILYSEPKLAFEYLDANKIDVRNNYLLAFTKANIALNNNKSALAQNILNNLNKDNGYMEVPAFNFEMGQAALFSLDDDCIRYFNRFLNSTKNNYFIKETYQKMSQYYWVMGNKTKADEYKNYCLQYGSAITDGDKQALRYAKSSSYPDATLLKIHLLCDGGNYLKANTVISKYKKTDFLKEADQLEFTYRNAQIYNALGQKNLAIAFYEETVKTGAERTEHYAARAALELGNIYEDQGQKATAIKWYHTCMDMKNHDYENSLEQKAKAALNRLK